MLAALDVEFHITTRISLLSTQQTFWKLNFDHKTDMKQFLDIFNEKLDVIQAAECKLTANNIIYQLSIAVGYCYDPLFDWLENHPVCSCNFSMFQCKLLETNERMELFGQKNLIQCQRRHLSQKMKAKVTKK